MFGRIKKLTDKGYGFIRSDEVKKDVFFHHSDVDNAEYDALQEGDGVTFDLEENDKGFIAKKVKVV